MADKAIEMFPDVLGNDGLTYVGLIEQELIDQGADAIYFGPINNGTGWDYLKAYIDTGHSLMVRTDHGVLTEDGHYIVAVGYQEDQGERTVIAYDPYGMWRGITCSQLGAAGCIGNYFTNAMNDPTSHVGQWVFYDFDAIFGDYLIAPAPPMSTLSRSATASMSAPDLISDEPRIIGTNPGIEYGELYYTFMPLIIR